MPSFFDEPPEQLQSTMRWVAGFLLGCASCVLLVLAGLLVQLGVCR